MIATLITNGYLLSVDRIRRLNHAGLDHLQISIDNVMPDEVSKKSLKVLDHKLRHLAQHAEFDVTINVVVGSGIRHPDDALVIARRAAALGFSTTVGIMHDHKGQMLPLDGGQRRILEAVAGMAVVAARLRALQPVSKESVGGTANRVAVPCRVALSVCL